MTQGYKCVAVVGSNPLEEIKYFYFNLHFYFLAMLLRQSAALNSATQQNSAENGERSVLKLGSLCVPCCVRDTV